jgi:rubrerythrin
MAREEVCYTREVALEKAVEMETKSFESYRNSYFTIQDRRAKELVKELALDELEHRYILEKSFFEEIVALHEAGLSNGPSMKLTLMLQEKPLHPSASEQEVMIHAIHEEKRAVDFYSNMAQQCGGAPMEKIFERLGKDEEIHLARLEELYESIYMQEM